MESIYDLAYVISGIINQDTLDSNYLESYNGENNNIFKKILKNIEPYDGYQKPYKIKKIGSGSNLYKHNIIKIDSNVIKKLEYRTDNLQIIKIFETFNHKDKIIYIREDEFKHDSYILYNICKNIGIYVTNGVLTEFMLYITTEPVREGSDYEKVIVACNVINHQQNNIKNYTKEYKGRYKSYYYYSSYCEWQEKNWSTDSYLSSFGNCPGLLNTFSEKLARYYLNILRDREYILDGDGGYSTDDEPYNSS
jgi:hypothetical protein